MVLSMSVNVCGEVQLVGLVIVWIPDMSLICLNVLTIPKYRMITRFSLSSFLVMWEKTIIKHPPNHHFIGGINHSQLGGLYPIMNHC